MSNRVLVDHIKYISTDLLQYVHRDITDENNHNIIFHRSFLRQVTQSCMQF